MHRDVHGSGRLPPRALRRRGGSDDGRVRRDSRRDHRRRCDGNRAALWRHRHRSRHRSELPVTPTANTGRRSIDVQQYRKAIERALAFLSRELAQTKPDTTLTLSVISGTSVLAFTRLPASAVAAVAGLARLVF